MRYMFLVRTAQMVMPPAEMIEAMHALAKREIEAGRMIQDGGLAPPQQGVQLRISGRKLVTDGPFAESKELLGGFAIFELPDDAAALASAREFMELHQRFMPDWEGSCEIRQIAGSQSDMIRQGG
jgi:hypothetical protein